MYSCGGLRCGKTYRLYQEMRRLQSRGVELDRMLYFNFEDERLRPYEPSLLADVLDTFYALYPAARTEGATCFFDEIRKFPNGVRFSAACSRYGESDRLCDGIFF